GRRWPFAKNLVLGVAGVPTTIGHPGRRSDPVPMTRLTLAGMMTLVALAATCSAFATLFLDERRFFFESPFLDLGVSPTAIALQVGLLRIVARRGGAGVSWLGFEAAGVAALLGYAAACWLAPQMVEEATVGSVLRLVHEGEWYLPRTYRDLDM